MAQVKHADLETLQELKTLSSFSRRQLEELARNLAVKTYHKDTVIFEQDEDAKLVYLILSGVVRVSYINSHNRQTIVSLLPAGEFFGLDSLTPNTLHPFRCEAFEHSVVGSIRPQSFIGILLGIPYDNFLRWYMGTMHSGRKLYVHCIRGIGLDLRGRLALELLNLGDRFGSGGTKGTLIGINISHEVLAGIVGASRQQVTQHLNEFDREKVIAREGRRIIINLAKLQRVIEAAD
ncbi:MAG TPA: Crp/Fnr family transcriptional regulator [Methylomirabilota bacterium]|nr:Crp/Fnr family transcriptional regulator [Methylomirabilota bacterium]